MQNSIVRVLTVVALAGLFPLTAAGGIPSFPFYKIKIADHLQPTSVALGPDGHLYVSNLDFDNTEGTVTRYVLDANGRYEGQSEVVLSLSSALIQGIVFDPGASSSNLVLWVSHNGGQVGNAIHYAGTISRVTIPGVGEGGSAIEQTYIDGLPVGAHAPNGIAFGPDGRLYITCGSMTPFGSFQWGRDETVLSATILVADVNAVGFGGGSLPVDVQTSAPVSYDPYALGAPVEIFATGTRNTYDIAWHSNGILYSCINQGSYPTASTPGCGGVPALLSPDSPEVLVKIQNGKYYGHPNPARNECVYNGGNPTAGVDPWEVELYPVETDPDSNWDSSLVIYDLFADGGKSPNGMTEYLAPGPLQNHLLIAFFSTSKTIQAYALDGGGLVTSGDALRDVDGAVIEFVSPLDVAVHPVSGRVYVADFGVWGAGTGGGVWVLDPLTACNCGDIDGVPGVVDLGDFQAFADCIGASPDSSSACACADANADGTIDLNDFASFARAFDQSPTGSPPTCP